MVCTSSILLVVGQDQVDALQERRGFVFPYTLPFAGDAQFDLLPVLSLALGRQAPAQVPVGGLLVDKGVAGPVRAHQQFVHRGAARHPETQTEIPFVLHYAIGRDLGGPARGGFGGVDIGDAFAGDRAPIGPGCGRSIAAATASQAGQCPYQCQRPDPHVPLLLV